VKAKIAIVLLAVALIASNALWAYKVFDILVTLDYRNRECNGQNFALKQTLKLLPIVASQRLSRAEIIAAAREPDDQKWGGPFEKDGYVWVGSVGLKFDTNGKLIEASYNGEAPD
jgi:hypothetical protein